MNITYTQEDYIRAIYLLSEEAKIPVKTSELVKNLQLSKSTVTQRIQDLQKKGWVKQEKYGPIILTPKGKKIADNLTYKHRIIELFLTKTLGMSEKEVHEEAHKLEHAISNKVVQHLAKFLDNPTHCPHGQKLTSFHTKIK